ncbi:MAG TPA: BBE domain-containing protein [Propionibacteriaceae bacterium]
MQRRLATAAHRPAPRSRRPFAGVAGRWGTRLLGGSFLAFGAGFVPVPEAMAPTRAWLGAFKASLEPYVAGNYLNFVEEPFDITRIFPPEVLDRLREVKQRYDPENLFHSNHPVTA